MKTIGFIFVIAFLMIIIFIKPVSEDGISIFYTGEVQGELEPCGCSGVKSGGILQRSGWISHLREKRSNLIVLDGGFSAQKENRQQEIKFTAHHKMLDILQCDFSFFSEKERRENKWIAAKKNQTHALREYDGKKILTLRLETENDFEIAKIQIEKISPDIVIAMTKGVGAKIPTSFPISENSWFIFLVNDAKEPIAAFSPKEKVLIMSAGNRGRYAGLLHFSEDESGLLKWQHKHITITGKYDENGKIAQTLEEYKRQVQSEHLLDLEIKRSSRVGFVGTDMCQSCHTEQHRDWLLKQDHARAFATLQIQNYDQDPECVKCHVVGYDFVEGFRNSEESDYLLHVGCESCHGAGADHAFSPEEFPKYGKTDGEKTCVVCHTKDHSADFKYNMYKQKIKHWK